jgi:hypothetical protein
MKTSPYNLLIASTLLLAVNAIPVWAQQTNEQIMRAHVSKGNYLLGRRQFQEAINEYQAVLDIDSTNQVAKSNIAEVYNSWAIMFYNQQKWGDALEQWQKALEIQPTHPHAKRNLALMKQRLAAQGVSLDGLAAETAERKAAAKQAGLDNNPPTAAKPPAAGALAPKEAPESVEAAPPSGAMILTPGIKISNDAPPAEDTPPPPVAPPKSAPQSAAEINASIFGMPTGTTSSRQPQPNNTPQNSVSPLFPVMPETRTSVQPPQPTSAPNSYQGPPLNSYPTTPAPPASLGSANSLEEQLTSVEVKVYGRKQLDMTMLQRLEKMERDTAGQTRSGTIIERINYLKQNYGL